MLGEIGSTSSVINHLWAKLGISRWLLSAVVFYYRWLSPYLQMQRTTYVSDVYAVDNSTVTRVSSDIQELQIQSRSGEMDDKTLVVFYFLDSKKYAIMLDLSKFDFAKDDIIPYEEGDKHDISFEHDEYLSLDYEGKDVTEPFLMYYGPRKNYHSDKTYALPLLYPRMIDAQGNRLFLGQTSSAVGILRSDLSTPRHIKISGDNDSEAD